MPGELTAREGQVNICRFFLVILALVVASGCATTPRFRVGVDSISSDAAPRKKTYVLLPSNNDTSAEDLQFKEFAAYVHRALGSQGFTVAPSIEQADITIFLAYGIGDPQRHQYTYAVPLWGQTGVSSSTTYGTLSTYRGFGTYSGTTTYTPTYAITGYSMGAGEYTTYFRFLLLDAYDLETFKKENKLVQVWKTVVTSTGSSGDLRRVVPALVAASSQYLGKNTGHKMEVVIEEGSPAVAEIKGEGAGSAKPLK